MNICGHSRSDRRFKPELPNQWILHIAEGCKCIEDTALSPQGPKNTTISYLKHLFQYYIYNLPGLHYKKNFVKELHTFNPSPPEADRRISKCQDSRDLESWLFFFLKLTWVQWDVETLTKILVKTACIVFICSQNQVQSKKKKKTLKIPSNQTHLSYTSTDFQGDITSHTRKCLFVTYFLSRLASTFHLVRNSHNDLSTLNNNYWLKHFLL